jgi:hypothetical protein
MLKFFERRHQDLGDEASSIGSEMAFGVGLGQQ